MNKLLKILTMLMVSLLCLTGLVACNDGDGDQPYSSPELANYEYEINGDGDGYVLTKYIGSKTATTITVPAVANDLPVVELGKNLFRRLNVTTVVLPDSVITIGEGAFNGCAKLTSVNAGKALYIKTSSFEGCSALASIDVGSAKSIGTKAFKDCVKLTQISIPSTCKTVQSSAFSGCVRLATVNLAQGVIELGDDAFIGCSALTNINLNYVEIIGNGAFNSCISLTSVSLDNVKLIGKQAFNSCSALTSATVGDKCILVYANSFVFCYRLERLKFADYDNSNKWMTVDYNLQNPENVWPHYLNTYGLADPVANANNFGTTMGNPKKDNFYCKRAYLDAYPEGFLVSYALAHDKKGCTCMSNGMPSINFTIDGVKITETNITMKVGETLKYGGYLTWGPGIASKDDKVTISSVKLGANWLQATDYVNDTTNCTLRFLHTFNGTVDVVLYNSTTSNLLTLNITVLEAD